MTGLEKLLRWQSMRGGISTEQATATGNPATFETDLRRDLTGLVVPFTPVQAGSGDPSPSNVRPITGRVGMNVYHSGADTSDPTVYPVSWQTEAGIVYNGNVDLTTGILTADFVYVTLKNQEIEYQSANTRFLVSVSNYNMSYALRAMPLFCTSYIVIADGRAIADVPDKAVYGGGKQAYIYLKDTRYTTPSQLVDEMGETQILYPVADAQKWQIDSQAIKTLVGVNTIWTDTNGTNTIKYLKKG